ncbi:cobalt-precorrin-6A reductase [Xinfangfangia sp. D13-10-4-6]|uniref:cobalt-precorrin-6A reductase n=1 Tax=Pseudogemmobacter hezensis TaxID=2737662 RepID=UPI001556DA11|nr:cobalt-precorrin-6A reductase [Pseudogemmobacter hezensis]NPD16563.1 cobalt-precorrin-6A reductase [Pseudogemmobacter hezensis]
MTPPCPNLNAGHNVLILGGTTEASRLAQLMASRSLRAVLSYAGRVETPRSQPIQTRTGGFGGAQGLADYLRAHQITHLIDATHPFAAQISQNAAQAAQMTGTRLIRLMRPAWQPGPGDNWRDLPDLATAAQMLAGPPRRVFLAIGRLHLADFTSQPQHDYLVRLVDPPDSPLPLPNVTLEIARGPFDQATDLALLRRHRSDLIIAKNAGGAGASAKLSAARELGLPVWLIARPALPEAETVSDPAEIMDLLHADLGV